MAGDFDSSTPTRAEVQDVYPDQFVYEAARMTRRVLEEQVETWTIIAHAWTTKQHRGPFTKDEMVWREMAPREALEAAYVAARMVDVTYTLATKLGTQP